MIETDLIKAREVAKTAARTLKPLRTERTTRMMAKEMAAAWWDESIKGMTAPPPGTPENYHPNVRSELFRKMWPDRQVYVTICWPHFYKPARQQMISMLGRNDVSEVMKVRIYEAIMEDRNEKGN